MEQKEKIKFQLKYEQKSSVVKQQEHWPTELILLGGGLKGGKLRILFKGGGYTGDVL